MNKLEGELEEERSGKGLIMATHRSSPAGQNNNNNNNNNNHNSSSVSVGGQNTSQYLEKLEVERKEKEDLLNTVYDLKKMITKLERSNKEASISGEEISIFKDKNTKLEKRVKALEQVV